MVAYDIMQTTRKERKKGKQGYYYDGLFLDPSIVLTRKQLPDNADKAILVVALVVGHAAYSARMHALALAFPLKIRYRSYVSWALQVNISLTLNISHR